MSAPQARIIHKIVPAAVEEDTLSESQDFFLLRSSKHIPDHHFFNPGLGGIEEWDLAWFDYDP